MTRLAAPMDSSKPVPVKHDDIRNCGNEKTPTKRLPIVTPAGRLSAAIEILATLEELRQPVAQILNDWGARHRFAGSRDRAAIAALVYDALRVRDSAAYVMGAGTPRAIALGTLVRARSMALDDIAALCSGEQHAPEPLSGDERARLAAPNLAGAPAPVAGDFPAWLETPLRRAFGDRLIAETAAMTARAPVDLRVNLLKSDRARALSQLEHLGAQATTLSPWGLRIGVAEDGRAPALTGEPAYTRGHVEVQDEGSQLAALLCGAEPGWQVLDLCAGGGGKTLALAAVMENRGQIYATDSDGRRLMPIYKRLERAGARNVQVRAPRGGRDIMSDLEDRCHLVLVDAPCTGSGTWRRNPDAKWRMRPGALDLRIAEQDAVLEAAAHYVRPGGRLVYVTCSLLCEENEDRIETFLASHPGFAPVAVDVLAQRCGVPELASCTSPHGTGLRLSPATTGTDGFYIAVLSRVG